MTLLPPETDPNTEVAASESWAALPLHSLRGLLMGAADIIPGVSGGTIALVLGIYGRLVGAISRVDLMLLALVKQRRWREAAAHIDLWFLMSLLFGIAVGIKLLAGLMHFLMTDPTARPYTLAALFGLIFGSCLLLARLVKWTPPLASSAIFAAAGAFWLVGLQGMAADADLSLGYVFLCGVIAICAMILPR